MKSLLAFMIVYWLLTFSAIAQAPTGVWIKASFTLIKIKVTNTHTTTTEITYHKHLFEEDQYEKRH